MESILEDHLSRVAEFTGFDFLSQATPEKIKCEWGFDVPVDKSSRIFDGAIYNSNNETLFLFETNFYNGGGSKLKSVAGEFSQLNDIVEIKTKYLFFVGN